MRSSRIAFLKTAPFLRLLPSLVAGILLQHSIQFSFQVIWVVIVLLLLWLAGWRKLSLSRRYIWRVWHGITLQLLMACMGAAAVYSHHLPERKNWIGNLPRAEMISAQLLEKPEAKSNYFRAWAKVEAVFVQQNWMPAQGYLWLYFQKKKNTNIPEQGTRIIFNQPIQPIAYTGNPGGFDYQRYSAYRNIYHQVFLKDGTFNTHTTGTTPILSKFLTNTRERMIEVLQKTIQSSKEAGVAEALLIGYKGDVDKSLLQSYSNTGVIHIIAISGLHLAMIYGLLLALLKPLRQLPGYKWWKPGILLGVLWAFSLLTGAGASILRASVMFSFIILSEILVRRSNLFNTLAASACCLLVYNPYFLWDIGFQLSYAAVLSILIFQQPIYKCLYFKNKLLDQAWKLNAITLSAQLLTLPLLLYHFHRFPNFFLFTNFVAVPLSAAVLYGCLGLLLVHPISLLCNFSAAIVRFLIAQLNGFIERSDTIPYAVTKNISFSEVETILLYTIILFVAIWIFQKKNGAFVAALGCLCAFLVWNFMKRMHRNNEQRLVVYQIPKKNAIDLIIGERYIFIGDPFIEQDPMMRESYLEPSRTWYHCHKKAQTHFTPIPNSVFSIANKSLLILSEPVRSELPSKKIKVNVIVLTGNPSLAIGDLADIFNADQWVFDSSNPLWKIQRWKKEADSLHLRHHSVPEQGAFTMER